MLTYREAAARLNLSYQRIAALVSQGTLHSEHVRGDSRKWLRESEVDWYDQYRKGLTDEPSPVRGDATHSDTPVSYHLDITVRIIFEKGATATDTTSPQG